MSYVAAKGGQRAIGNAEELMELLRTRGAAAEEAPLSPAAIEHQLHFLHSSVMSEGGLYDPRLASLAIKQSLGDPLEASFFLRSWRSTRPRLTEAPTHRTDAMRLIRRISSTFKEVPGGQMLGPTPDYTQRLFNLELLDESPEAFRAALRGCLDRLSIAPSIADVAGDGSEPRLPKVLDELRRQGLVEEPAPRPEPAYDITRRPLVFPVPRSAVLATLTRGHHGAVMGFAYSTMRGYGDTHPTIAELRVGYLPVELQHPVTGESVEVGEVLVTECEIVAMFEQGEAGDTTPDDGRGPRLHYDRPPTLSLGYGACFGHNELKAIAMAILDRAIQVGKKHGPRHPAEDPEFVLMHVDGISAMGFTLHWKLPHYVTFQSDLDRLRRARGEGRATDTAADSRSGTHV